MIRLATPSDIPVVVDMAKRFISFAPHGKMANATTESLEQAAVTIIEHGAIFLAEVNGQIAGMLWAFITPIWFAQHTPCATELAWWVEEEHRGGIAAIRLVRAFEEWAKAQGASMATMCDMVVEGQPPVGDIIMRLGYVPSERTFVKEL